MTTLLAYAVAYYHFAANPLIAIILIILLIGAIPAWPYNRSWTGGGPGWSPGYYPVGIIVLIILLIFLLGG